VRHLARPNLLWTVAAAIALLVTPAPRLARAAVVPLHNRVVVVVMENKSYDQVRFQPYTASLIAAGGTLTQSYGLTHPSQPNYIALWAGNLLGVTNDNCPAPGSPFSAENLGHACEAAGKTWRAYSENLPSAGATGCSYDGTVSSGLYTRKHDPWTYFTNVTHTNERPYSDLAADIAGNALPNLVFIIPNNCHNTHNSSTAGCGIADGDAWLAANLPAVIGALGPDGVLILTWDEDNNLSSNHILTVFTGPHVQPGSAATRIVQHYTIVRTICDLLGLTPFGPSATETPITEIWRPVVSARSASWGHLKTFYR
jgi:phospholipase C